jgi:hypothetical protein
MLLELVRGKVVVRIPMGEDEPIREEIHQLVEDQHIADVKELFALSKGFDMLTHILDHYVRQENHEGEVGEIINVCVLSYASNLE